MFRGSLPALVTPMKNGEVDFDVIQELVEWHINQGSNGLVPVGTTGESPTLSHQEHDAVVDCVVNAAKGRIPIIAGAGSNNTAEAIYLTKHAEKAGADAALVVTPYYNKPSQEGLLQHFTKIANSVDIPIVIYNIPGRSIVDMSNETMSKLFEVKNIVGVKDATGDIPRVYFTRSEVGNEYNMLSGDDSTTLAFMTYGGHGAISVTSNIAPKLCSDLQAATLNGNYKKALEYQDLLMPLHKAIFTEPGVCGAKYGLSVLGKCSAEVRSPLSELTSNTKKLIESAMSHAGL